jgi:putative endopeptidase
VSTILAERLESNDEPIRVATTAAIELNRFVLTIFAFFLTASALVGRADEAQVASVGIDLESIDPAVKPGDDFYRHANGLWLRTAKIPADQSSWGTLSLLAQRSDTQVQDLIQNAANAHAAVGTNEQKIGDYYTAFLDANSIERQGLAPAKHVLDAIDNLRTHEDVAALIASPSVPLDGPIAWAVTLDEKNPDRYILGIGQSGLSLPDREYYLKTEREFAAIRAKFKAHAARMLALAGHRNAKKEADSILALETEIARLHWELARRRDRNATYNLLTVAALESEVPDYPWAASLASAELQDVKEVVVAEMSAMEPLARLFKATPVSTWRSYLAYQYLTSEASVLPKAFDQENFEFYDRVLNGQPRQRPRWKRAVQATNTALGEAIGQLYVARYFPPEAKVSVEELVGNLRKAYANHISSVSWMTPDTKKVALEKLAAFRAKIGYPNKWRDYSLFEVKPGDAFGNFERLSVFEWRREAARLNQPTDRDEWEMTPQEVNAYYNPVFNEVVFPAAILQPPFFDPKADPAVNYGAIGAVIGHEMSHGFDDEGSKSDARGVLRSWWQAEDIAALHQRTEALVAQFDSYEPIKGLHINGRLTLGENMGDLGGVTIALDAYRLSLGSQAPAVLEGTSGEQRFFLSLAQAFKQMDRGEALRNQVMSDEHSPMQFRVNGVVRNVDAWYGAFGIQPTNNLYLAPDSRVHIW